LLVAARQYKLAVSQLCIGLCIVYVAFHEQQHSDTCDAVILAVHVVCLFVYCCNLQECVRMMMTYSDKRRPTARDMLKHEWIREGGVAGCNVIEPEVLHRMRSFAAMNMLKKKALLVSNAAMHL
jgi:hypothetical protein